MGKMAKLHGGGQRWKPTTGGDPQFKIKFLNLITDGSEESGELASSGPSQISGLRGWIDDLTYDFKLDSDGAGFLFHPDEYGFAYPKVISLSFRFVPYFENTPGWFKGAPGDGGYKFTQPSYPYGYKGEGEGAKQILEGSSTGATVETINAINKQRIDRALGSIYGHVIPQKNIGLTKVGKKYLKKHKSKLSLVKSARRTERIKSSGWMTYKKGDIIPF